jgi:hypothetical protein
MGGVWTRLKLAFAAFFTILFKGRLPAALAHDRAVGSRVVAAPAAPPATATAPRSPAAATAPTSDPSDRAIQLLALLQRDGRLVDFLMEDLATYSDAQVGAAVRDVHAGCRGVVSKYVTLDAVLAGTEGAQTTIGQDVDPAAVRLVGNVTGQPPFRGRLLHRGWRATRVELPPLGAPAGRAIVAQAEVEVT